MNNDNHMTQSWNLLMLSLMSTCFMQLFRQPSKPMKVKLIYLAGFSAAENHNNVYLIFCFKRIENVYRTKNLWPPKRDPVINILWNFCHAQSPADHPILNLLLSVWVTWVTTNVATLWRSWSCLMIFTL